MLSENRAKYGAALYVSNTVRSIKIDQCIFSFNHANLTGGAMLLSPTVYAADATCAIQNSRFCENSGIAPAPARRTPTLRVANVDLL